MLLSYNKCGGQDAKPHERNQIITNIMTMEYTNGKTPETDLNTETSNYSESYHNYNPNQAEHQGNGESQVIEISQVEIVDEYEEAEKYIETLTGSRETKMTFSAFHDKDKKKKPYTFFGTLKEHYEELSKLNSENYGIFVTIQETFSEKRKAEDIGAVRGYYVDKDGGKELPPFHLEPSMIVESSPGKQHIYWMVKDPTKTASEVFKNQIQKLIEYYDGDKRCIDLPRVLRLPGFNHCKNEPTIVKIVGRNDNKYEAEDICNLPTKTIVKSQTSAKNFDETQVTDDYINQLHKFAIKKIEGIKALKRGKRHNTLNKTCYVLGGALANYPLLFDYYLGKTHETVTELENSGIWDKDANSHQTIDKGFEDGKKKPYELLDFLQEKPCEAVKLKIKIEQWLEKDTVGELRWNEMMLRLEEDGKEVETNRLRQRFQQEMNYDAGKDEFKDLFVDLIQQNYSYHPVKEYLDGLSIEETAKEIDMTPEWTADFYIKEMIEYMCIQDNSEIQMHQFIKWCKAAVARIYDSGCKVDNVLILKGKQGIGKTSFFQTLFGDYFQTVGGHKSEADELLAIRQAWCSEYGEIESTFDRKGISQLKAFLTKTQDTFRAPYAPAPLTVSRNFIFCGTTNEDEFLADSTGNRRYWTIDILEKIDLKKVKEIRDNFWASIKYQYFQGIIGIEPNGKPSYVDFLWWMNDEEELKVEENTKKSEQVDPWEDNILNLLMTNEYISAHDILIKLELPIGRAFEMRIANILKKEKCSKHQKIWNGKKQRFWRLDSYWDNREPQQEYPVREKF